MSNPGPEQKIPIGIPDLDHRLNGGVRPGSTITPIGPFGSGVREFVDSAAVMHGNWQADTELFELEYESIAADLHKPSDVHYVSFLSDERRLKHEIEGLVASDWVEPALDAITVHDFGLPYAGLGPIHLDETGRFTYEGLSEDASNEYQEFMQTMGDYFESLVDDSIIFWDATTDLLPVIYQYLDWVDLYFILQTFCYRISQSDSVLIAGTDASILDDRERALVERAFDGVLAFDWFGDGASRRRTLEISQFPEYHRENRDEERVIFDVRIDRESFGIDKIQKIPPR